MCNVDMVSGTSELDFRYSIHGYNLCYNSGLVLVGKVTNGGLESCRDYIRPISRNGETYIGNRDGIQKVLAFCMTV